MGITNIRPQVISEGDQSVTAITDQTIMGQYIAAPTNPLYYEKIPTVVSAQLSLPPQARTDQGGLLDQLRGVADAAIQSVLQFMRSSTVIFVPPPPPLSPPTPPTDTTYPVHSSPAPTQNTALTAEPSPNSAASKSLLPAWAQMFKLTGDCEFRPGGASNNAYLDLREALKGKIKTLEVLSEDGSKVLAAGKYEGLTKEGKPRYRFNVKGADLPNGAIVKATLADTPEGSAGGIRYIEIPKPSQKFVW